MPRLRDPSIDGAFIRQRGDGGIDRMPTIQGAHGVRFEEPLQGMMVVIYFENPVDVPKYEGPYAVFNTEGHPVWWTRAGTTLDDLSLTPSIALNAKSSPPGWHGFVTNGEVTTV